MCVEDAPAFVRLAHVAQGVHRLPAYRRQMVNVSGVLGGARGDEATVYYVMVKARKVG